MFPTSSPQSMMLGGRPGFDYPSPIGMTHIPTMDSANRGGLSKHRQVQPQRPSRLPLVAMCSTRDRLQEHSGFVADFDLNSYHHGGGGGGYNLYFNSQYEPPDDGPLEHLRQPPTIGKYAPHEREALLERFRKKRAERCYNRQVGCQLHKIAMLPSTPAIQVMQRATDCTTCTGQVCESQGASRQPASCQGSFCQSVGQRRGGHNIRSRSRSRSRSRRRRSKRGNAESVVRQ